MNLSFYQEESGLIFPDVRKVQPCNSDKISILKLLIKIESLKAGS